MDSVVLQLLLIFALILLNGAFALSEIAVVAARKPRLERRAKEGDAGARRALALSNDKNDFLSTVQVGISLIGILAGAYGGARLAQPLGEAMAALPVVGAYAAELAFALVVGAITYLTLVVGELVPKRMALAGARAGRPPAGSAGDAEWKNPSAGRFQTAAGLVIGRLGRMARAGDTVEEPPLRFEVVDTDGPRVDKLLVSRL